MAARVTSAFSFRPNRAGRSSSRRNAPTAEALENRRLLSYAPSRMFGLAALAGDATADAFPAKATPLHAGAGAHGLAETRAYAPGAGTAVPIVETEPRGTEGRNDTQATAQFLPGFGTGSGDDAAADVRGSAESFQPVTPREDDGSIRRANATGAVPGTTAVFDAEGRIGDGPHGSAGAGTGDYDHYAVSASAGQLLTVFTSAAWLGSTLDTALAIYDSTGALVASNDDVFDNPAYGTYPDSFIRLLVPAGDTYSVVVFGSGSGPQANPFDAASGGGFGSEGFYRLDILLDAAVLVGPAEDDGAIPLANDTGLRAGAKGTAFARATIGDGPHGSAGTGTGDFDFYRLDAAAGQTIAVDTDTPVPLVGVDTAVGIYDGAGNLLAFNDDDFQTFDSYLLFEAPATGTYFVVVSVYPGLLPADPFDPASGPGVGTEGDYSLTIDLVNAPTSDFYSFDLEAGDIIGAALFQGADRLNLYDPDGTLLVGTFSDITRFFQPQASPLPGGASNANSALSYVINSPGRYVMEVTYGFAGYALQLGAFRPVLERQPVFSHQVLFLDFDGATLAPGDIPDTPGVPTNPNATLSPLSSFLGAFGLAASDESALIDAIVATVAENYAEDVSGVVGRGRNGDFQVTGRAGEFQIEILNSRDHPDPYGLYPNVSRVIVGGTRQELGANVIGVSPTIDVGNFDTSETAAVLLDLLSQALPQWPRAPGATLVDLIGVVVGDVASHEAGHFFGNYHTDPFTDPIDFLNLMNRGFPLDFGPDRTFGTPDDVDLDFGLSDYSRHPNEIFDGVADTLNTIAFGLSTGTKAGTYFDFVTGTLYVSGNLDDGHKDELKVRARGDNLEVLINGALADTRPLAAVRHVFFNGSGDRDSLDATGLDLPVTMLGRGGDDELTGGRANDLLLGGRGKDDLRGGGGDDILVAGHTAFDTNTAALRAVLDEWTSSRDFATRVANLGGSGSGPRLNGEVFLRTTGLQTVFDDAGGDDLTGGSGRDWFFARVSAKDVVGDLRNDDVLTPM